MRDPHSLLGVSENEIRRSYRKLVREHHPDLNPGDPEAEERFKELQQAYEMLTNSRRRGQENQAPRRRAGGSRPGAGRRAGASTGSTEGPSDFLGKFGYKFGNRTGGVGDRSEEVGDRSEEVREEDAARILKCFGIDTARFLKVGIRFGDATGRGRHPPEGNSGYFEKPPVNEDFKKPPKPPRPPRW